MFRNIKVLIRCHPTISLQIFILSLCVCACTFSSALCLYESVARQAYTNSCQHKSSNTCAHTHTQAFRLPFFAQLSLNYDANKHEIFMDFTEILCLKHYFFPSHLHAMALSQINNHNKLPPQINHANSRHNGPIYNNV